MVSRVQLSPGLVRLTLGGEGARQFQDNGLTDKYVKLLFTDPSSGQEAPRGVEHWRAALSAGHPVVRRTYTVRAFDAARAELTIDFVVHGDAGIAAPWAAHASPGEVVAAVGPGGGYAPRPDAVWHLLAGDLTALPAIAAALEALPGEARGLVHLEIHDLAEKIALPAPPGVEVRWLVADPQDVGALAGAVDSGPWESRDIQVFAHGERESIKAVRRVLRQREVPRDAISISGYWARGRTEDAFQAEKREPIGKIDD